MKKIKGNTYVLEGYTNIGIYITGGEVFIIDTGSDQRISKGILEELTEKKLKVSAIINTHSHADHIQGNHLIQESTGCPIYASKIEAAMISNPMIEGFYLYSAYPIRALRRTFFRPKPSNAKDIAEISSRLPIEIIDLQGHSLGHIGLLTPDGVLFCGDAYFSEDILKKYIYPYHAYVQKAIESLRYLENIAASYYVPSHGNVTSDPHKDINYNVNLIQEISTRVFGMLITPMTRDEITSFLVRSYDIKLNSGLYYLAFSFVSSVLQYLETEGKVSNSISADGKSIWFSTEK